MARLYLTSSSFGGCQVKSRVVDNRRRECEGWDYCLLSSYRADRLAR